MQQRLHQWSARYGVPLLLKSGGRTVLSVTKVETTPGFPSTTLHADWQEHNADEDLTPD